MLPLIVLSGSTLQEVRNAASAPSRTADEAAIRATYAANVAALIKGDAAGIAATYTSDGDLWVVGFPRISGRQALREANWPAVPSDEKIAFTIDNIRFPNSDTAIVEGSSRHVAGAVQATSRGTFVFVRQGATWLIAAGRVMERH
jgi:uncharacterized protein (TIGR02246 family)